MALFPPPMALKFRNEYRTLVMTQQITFSQWLTEQMERCGFNQTTLAQRAGLSQQYIGSLVRSAPHSITGRPVKPTIEAVDKIAKALSVPLTEARLAAGYAPAEVSSDLETQIRQSEFADLYEKFLQLPPDAKEGVEPFVDLLNREIEKRLANIKNPPRPKPTHQKKS